MIVDTMSLSEINNQYESDSKLLDKYIGHQIPKFNRLLLKQKKFPCFMKPFDYVTKNNNKFRVYISFPNKNINQMFYCPVLLQNVKNGIIVYCPNDNLKGGGNINTMIPHFFSRYNERMNLGLTGIDLIDYYFKHNRSISVQQHPDNENQFAAKIDDGEIFGDYVLSDNKRFLLIKTFITNSMLKGNQPKFFENLQRLRLDWTTNSLKNRK